MWNGEFWGSWSHRFDDVLAVQLHAAVSKDHVENTGIAVEWTPSERITILEQRKGVVKILISL